MGQDLKNSYKHSFLSTHKNTNEYTYTYKYIKESSAGPLTLVIFTLRKGCHKVSAINGGGGGGGGVAWEL